MKTVLGKKNLSTMSAYELIQKLNEDYPPRCIGKEQDLYHAHRYAGQRDLVESLLAKLKVEES